MGWGSATRTSQFRFNIESDEEREINTDWFSREIINGAITANKWEQMSERVREGINRGILKHDPDEEKHAAKLKKLVMQDWAGLSETQADALVAAWKKRPRPDSKRLKMSRRAVRNLLKIMDREEPWPDSVRDGQTRWLTQIEARKLIADDPEFLDATTAEPLTEHARRRYRTGSKGATARDRHYIKKHLLKKNGELIYGPDGQPLHEPPPAPLISNPVVRKAIHEVRRHLVEYMVEFERKPDEIYVELARDAKMGKKDADAVLERSRLRSRIKKDIVKEFDLDGVSSTQREEAVKRVILAVQQGCVCPLCGKRMGGDCADGMTLRTAAQGKGCELAHIIPARSGGHNGLGNLVLAHIKCNRDMDRRTPREFWGATLPGGFDEGMRWIEGIYGEIARPKSAEVKNAEGPSLWLCYFGGRPRRWGPTFDEQKIEQFKKDIKDIQGMTERQMAATRYAARQVMAYLADALFDGEGLPERGGRRQIFASDGLWTSRLRREWGFFFDPHHAKAKALTSNEERQRVEKNRGDHRHHSIDAVVIALASQQVRNAWENREKQADSEGVNTADEEMMENYRKTHRLELPAAFGTREEFRAAVQKAVFGEGQPGRPVCHRAVKRKLIDALHKETLFGPVVDKAGNLTESYTAKKSVLQLEPNHLRRPALESKDDALRRIAALHKLQGVKPKEAKEKAAKTLDDPSYKPRLVDPPPGKSGIVRDLALRMRIRECLSQFRCVKKSKSGEPTGDSWHINPDDFSENEIKQAVEAGAICQASGVPIRSVVLLRTMKDPVVVNRKSPIYGSEQMLPDNDPASRRAYDSQNNHHIELRVTTNKSGKQIWSGEIVSGFQTAQRNLARLKAIREAGIPKATVFRKLPKAERTKWSPVLREIEKQHPLVDRSDNQEKGGSFVMSLAEGELLLMKRKGRPEEVGYFVVAKLNKPQTIVLVPHWDARSATPRKDADGNKVPDSQREQYEVTPNDLKELAPPGCPHAIKVRVSPLGNVRMLKKD